MKRLIIALCMCVCLAAIGAAHEGGPNRVRHLTDPSESIIGLKNCGPYAVWPKEDPDNPGTVGQCVGVFISHDVIHTFPVRMKMTIQPPYEPKIGCTCEPVVTEMGGDS